MKTYEGSVVKEEQKSVVPADKLKKFEMLYKVLHTRSWKLNLEA